MVRARRRWLWSKSLCHRQDPYLVSKHLRVCVSGVSASGLSVLKSPYTYRCSCQIKVLLKSEKTWNFRFYIDSGNTTVHVHVVLSGHYILSSCGILRVSGARLRGQGCEWGPETLPTRYLEGLTKRESRERVSYSRGMPLSLIEIMKISKKTWNVRFYIGFW